MIQKLGGRSKLLAVALISAGCTPPVLPKTPFPNVVVITVDGLEAELLRCYGNQGQNAPRIDALAECSVVFEQAFAPAWQSAPGTATLWTGRHPRTHGVRGQDGTLDDAWPTLAERLYAKGVLTCAVQSDGVLSNLMGFAQGFEVYDETIASTNVDREDTSAGVLFPLATSVGAEWIADRERDEQNESWLLWMHYASPQPDWPWAPTDERPVEVVTAADAAVGALLDAVEAIDATGDTLVVLIGSDGGRRGARVPLIVHLPQLVPRAVPLPVSTVDLYPTVLELFGLGLEDEDEEATAGEGRSLVRPLLGLDLDRGPVLARGETHASVVFEDWRYEHERNGLWRRLFHVRNDPGCTLDLARERPDDVARLAAQLAELEAGGFAWPPPSDDPAPENPTTQDQ
ncbi:MAG: sulfatase-like hydrolase/transferase [bacterium]|nr:sulfatase-like hydrolase/transferase [bacterium]